MRRTWEPPAPRPRSRRRRKVAMARARCPECRRTVTTYDGRFGTHGPGAETLMCLQSGKVAEPEHAP